jgi:Family of unknown function (DUF6163)
MSDPMSAIDQVAERPQVRGWTLALVWYLRVLAAVAMVKGLYHWSAVIGISEGNSTSFETAGMAWQAATVFFAVIDLVAAVGLWLAAAWGGVVWLTAAISMAAVGVFFPQVYGFGGAIVFGELLAILIYVGLAVMAARERPE